MPQANIDLQLSFESDSPEDMLYPETGATLNAQYAIDADRDNSQVL